MTRPEEMRALVEALKPFAAFADQIAKERPGWDHDGFTFGGPLKDTKLTMGDFRRARNALTRAESSLASPAGMEGWMPIETVYVVGGTVGEWSDRSEWTVGVWVSEEDANTFVEKISALGRIFEQAIETRNNDDWSDESEAAVAKAEDDCRAVDPGWSDYCGDAPHYTVWPEKLIFPAAPRAAPAQQPVAWRYRYPNYERGTWPEWTLTLDGTLAREIASTDGEFEPLYTAPSEPELRAEIVRLQAEVERLTADRATVARIWKSLGIKTYEEAGGREISEIVADLTSRVEALSAEVGTARAEAFEPLSGGP